MTGTEQCNGYANYETWRVANCAANGEQLHDAARAAAVKAFADHCSDDGGLLVGGERLARDAAADAFRTAVTNAIGGSRSGWVAADLLRAAFDQVDWAEAMTAVFPADQEAAVVIDAVPAWRLASMAETSRPDSVASAGAAFLNAVRNDFLDQLAPRLLAAPNADMTVDGEYVSDVTHRIADDAVPVYDDQLWATFGDLGAWCVDIDELRGPGDDLRKLAGTALYQAARNLAAALASFYVARQRT